LKIALLALLLAAARAALAGEAFDWDRYHDRRQCTLRFGDMDARSEPRATVSSTRRRHTASAELVERDFFVGER
jgi:hypothetical protein